MFLVNERWRGVGGRGMKGKQIKQGERRRGEIEIVREKDKGK